MTASTSAPDLMPCGRLSRCTLALLAVAATACDLTDSDVICTTHIEWGLRVSVQDLVTGAPTASGARLIVRDGSYADTSSQAIVRVNPDSAILLAAAERSGVYTVTVEKSGFLTWERVGVVVTIDDYDCHVIPVNLVARLRRAP